MNKKTPMALITASILNFSSAIADTNTEITIQQLKTLNAEHSLQIRALEKRLSQAEKNTDKLSIKLGSNNFNPAISLILDGRYTNFDNKPANYALPGFALGGEAGIGTQGLAIGHSELVFSANIDTNFFGQTTFAFSEQGTAIEVELEEAFVQTLGLGNGLTLKTGRFFSEMGYLNNKHSHTWDFSDAPLIYRALFGDILSDNGIQLTYIAPTDTFLQLGTEIFSGNRYPDAGRTKGIGSWTAFIDLGGDIGFENSWQLGFSHWQSDGIDGRQTGANANTDSTSETPSYTGDSKINAVDFVYKWAPGGNSSNQSLKVQYEYFDRKENGTLSILNSGPPTQTSTYAGNQNGWYALATYKFDPQWQTSLRYDQLASNNIGSNTTVLNKAGLITAGHTPKRTSVALEWLHSEFSKVRLQYNHDQSYNVTDNQIYLQYTMSIGSHGAHQF